MAKKKCVRLSDVRTAQYQGEMSSFGDGYCSTCAAIVDGMVLAI